jgi:uroporphyrin-3 C-methyltransferase
VNETEPHQQARSVSAEPIAVPGPGRAAPNPWKWALVIAVLASATALFGSRLTAAQRELKAMQQRTEEVVAQHLRDLAEQKALQERIEATARRTEQLEQQLTVLAGRDTAADAELRRVREEHVLAEVDELLTLASSQLQIVHDPVAAATALASADARLARLPRPQFFALREALARDIERLRKTPTVDIGGIAIRLDRLVQGVDSWHLLSDPVRVRRLAAAPAAKPRADSAPTGRFGWIGRELGDALRDAIRITTVEAPDSLLLPPDHQVLVREHLRVRLLTARQAMLMRSPVLFRADLGDAQVLINRYFDGADPLVAAALAQLKALESATIDAPMPALDDSLAALRAARPTTP